MRRIVSGQVALLTALLLPHPAQAAVFQPAEGEEGEEDMIILEDEMEGEEPAAEGGEGQGEQPTGEAAAGLDDLLEGEDAKEAEADAKKVQAQAGKQDKNSEEKQIKTETKLITVIQRQRMLKKKRVDIQPQVGISINDPYVRQYSFGAEISYWLTNRMALSLTGTGFVANRTPRYDNIKLQTGLLLTANKTLWQAHLNFQYNPFYGKIAIFNRFLLHWEGFVQIGGGVMQTEVIPRFEALHEPFRTFTGGGQFTIGARLYFPRLDWFSVNFGARTWIFPDKLEPSNRGPGDMNTTGNDPALDDPDAAKKASKFQVQFQTVLFLGLSFYFPTSFEYTTPR